MSVLIDRIASPLDRLTDHHDTGRPVVTRRENLLTVAFATWLILGIFVDGWAHNNDKPESFFTPWHGLFYSGFLATATWMGHLVLRHRTEGARERAAVPIGYGLGLLAVGVFAFGGMADMAWHEIFGIEVDLEALLSPSHLLLFVGGLLVVTSPLRATWADPTSRAPGFRELLPALLSMTLATATVAFFFMNFSPSLTGAMTDSPYRLIATRFSDPDVASWMVEEVQVEGYASILVTTLILLAPALLLARRWVLPFGTMTFLFGVVSTLVAAIESFDMGVSFAAAALAGLVGDAFYQRLGATPQTPCRLRWLAMVVPFVMWLAYFGILGTFMTVGWSVELWSGVCVMSALAGLALSLLVVPPVIPSPNGQPER